MTNVRSNLLIGGSWQAPSTDATFEVRSPHDQRLVAVVPKAAPADADIALERARAALEGPWASSSPKDRAEVIRQLSRSLQARGEEIAATVTDEMGSPAKFSIFGQAFAATSVLDGFADLA
ncbi:MAG TPA: aldehyde dehydrogenase family protein, partial [Microthrixaceae bacterium]|nr:aldehyde dehydrogenase family protein [Microthrixaceae bacterium]